MFHDLDPLYMTPTNEGLEQVLENQLYSVLGAADMNKPCDYLQPTSPYC